MDKFSKINKSVYPSIRHLRVNYINVSHWQKNCKNKLWKCWTQVKKTWKSSKKLWKANQLIWWHGIPKKFFQIIGEYMAKGIKNK